MNWIRWICAVCLLCAGAFVAGRFTAPKPAISTASNTATTERVVERVITKTPEGETRIVEREVSNTQTEQKTSEPAPAPAKPNYSVGVQVPVKQINREFDWRQVTVEVGRRIIGDIWGQISYQQATGFAVGVRVDL